MTIKFWGGGGGQWGGQGEGGSMRGGVGGGISERGVGGLFRVSCVLGVADFLWGILVHCGSEGGVWASGRGHVCWVVSMTRALIFKDSGRRLSPGSTQPSTELRPEEAGRPICRPFSILIVPAWSTKRSRNRRQHWLPQKYTCRTLQSSVFSCGRLPQIHIFVCKVRDREIKRETEREREREREREICIFRVFFCVLLCSGPKCQKRKIRPTSLILTGI